MAFTTTEVGSTEDVIIRSIVQEQLLSRAVIRPTVMDMSSEAGKGVKEVELPRYSAAFGAPDVQNADGTTPVAFKTVTLDVDTLALDQWKNLPYRIPDRISTQNRVNLEAETSASAGQEMAIDLDTYILTQLATATQNVQFSGTGNVEIAIADINKAKRALKKNNVTDLDGEIFLLISPDQESHMLNIDNFISADKYGARDALLNGEIGRVYGARVIVSNLLADAESYMYHRSCCAFAAQKDISFERQRADVTLQAWDYSYSVGYGAKLLDAGKRIVKMSSAVDANLP